MKPAPEPTVWCQDWGTLAEVMSQTVEQEAAKPFIKEVLDRVYKRNDNEFIKAYDAFSYYYDITDI